MSITDTSARRSWLFLVAIIGATTALFVVALRAIDGPAHIDAKWRIERAQLLSSAQPQVSLLPQQGWEAVSLPDVSAVSDRKAAPRWYRMRLLPPDSTGEPWALYAQQAFGRMEIYLDGIAVGADGPVAASAAHRAPLFMQLPTSLTARAKMLVVRVGGDSKALDTLHVGPSSELRAAYRHALAIKVQAKQIILGVLLGAGLMVAVLFSLRRQDRHYGWFAFVMVACAVSLAASLHQGQSSQLAHVWEAIAASAAMWSVIGAALFVNRMVEQPWRPVERHIVVSGSVITCASLALTLVLGRQPSVLGLAASDWMMAAVGGYIIVRLVSALRREWRISTCLLLIVAGLIAIVHVLDTAFVLNPQWLEESSMLAYTSIPALTVLGTLILGRFVAALKESEALHGQLDARLAIRSREVEQSVVRFKDIEREEALSAERQRIMRDMHDGIGGQLLQAVATVESDPTLRSLEPALRASLDDLRLVVDSLSNARGDLFGALAMMRWRVGKRLHRTQVKCEWHTEEIGSSVSCRTEEVLQTLRAIHRGINAALERGATRVAVSVRLGSEEPAIAVEVAHEGVGQARPSFRAVIPLQVEVPRAPEHTL